MDEATDDVVDETRAPEVGVVQFRCESCGGEVTATPGEDALTCAHCGHAQAIDRKAGRVLEYDFRQAIADAPTRSADEMIANGRQVECKECGARTVLAGQAGKCPFCGSPVVADLVSADEFLLPESLLPHRVTREQAKTEFRGWIKSRWFAPGDLARRAKTQGMDGVFLPYWTYDSNTTTHYRGARGEHYWVTEHYTDSKGNRRSRSVRKTRWYSASGTVQRSFDDVLICASTSLPAKHVQELEPWDLAALQPYDAAYLAGFVAERYRVDLESGFELAEARMEPEIRSDVRSDIGGDEQRIYSMDIHHQDVKFKHVLLPLWISSFKYSDRTFRVMVNARTGEVQGERPWSWIKITLLVLFLAALIGGGVYLYLRSQQPTEPEYEESDQTQLQTPSSAYVDSVDAEPALPPPPEGSFDLVAAVPEAIAEAHKHGKKLGLTSITANEVAPSGLALLGAVTYDFRSPRGAKKQVCDVWVEFDVTGMRWQTTDETPDAEACGKPLVVAPTCTTAAIWQRAIAQGAPANVVAELHYDAAGEAKQDTPRPGKWTFTAGAFEAEYPDDCAATSPESPASSATP